MKPLYILPFLALAVVLLTVSVLAGQYVVRSDIPLSEVVTFREMPTYAVSHSGIATVSIGEPVVIPIPYTAAKPTEMPIALPEPLVLTPFLPIQDLPPSGGENAAATPDIFRGQVGVENLGEILRTAAPLAKGPVAEGTIDPKLLEGPALSDSELGILGEFSVSDNPGQAPSWKPSGTASADPLGYGVLVAALIFTTLGLIYMAFIAYDNHQRWVRSLTEQNDRYLGGGAFDLSTEDTYGSSVSFSDGFGLTDGFSLARRSI